MPIVVMQPERQFCGTVIGVWIGDGVGPFPECGLDEALGLAVGPGRVGFRADMPEAELAAGLGERLRAVARALAVMTRVTVTPRLA
jgi:hypothetical protein